MKKNRLALFTLFTLLISMTTSVYGAGMGKYQVHLVGEDNISKKLDGVEFDLYRNGSEFVKSLTTDKWGMLSIREDFGNYTLEQTSAYEGYKLLDEIINIRLEKNVDSGIYIGNEKKAKSHASAELIDITDDDKEADYYRAYLKLENVNEKRGSSIFLQKIMY